LRNLDLATILHAIVLPYVNATTQKYVSKKANYESQKKISRIAYK
jgi:hypothetical protein